MNLKCKKTEKHTNIGQSKKINIQVHTFINTFDFTHRTFQDILEKNIYKYIKKASKQLNKYIF